MKSWRAGWPRPGASDWLAEEDRRPDRSPHLSPCEPRECLEAHQGPRRTSRALWRCCKELAAWREGEAQRNRDLPRNRMLRDETLLEIAAHAPTIGRAIWPATRGLSRTIAEGRMGVEILAAVERGLGAAGRANARARRRGADLPLGRSAPGGTAAGAAEDAVRETRTWRRSWSRNSVDLEAIAADDDARSRRSRAGGGEIVRRRGGAGAEARPAGAGDPGQAGQAGAVAGEGGGLSFAAWTLECVGPRPNLRES